jgi:hypothetical protein
MGASHLLTLTTKESNIVIMDYSNFKGRSLLTWLDYSGEEIRFLLDFAKQLKEEKKRGEINQRLVGKTVALLFEKRSTRTRCAFETAIGEENSCAPIWGKCTSLPPSGPWWIFFPPLRCPQ